MTLHWLDLLLAMMILSSMHYALNDIGLEFKELGVAVRARDTVISFEEFHDKLVEYDSFLKREETKNWNAQVLVFFFSFSVWLLK